MFQGQGSEDSSSLPQLFLTSLALPALPLLGEEMSGLLINTQVLTSREAAPESEALLAGKMPSLRDVALTHQRTQA